MRTSISFFFLLAASVGVLLGQQKSDYATVQRFQSLIKSISSTIDEAKTVQDCAEANTAVDALEKEFREDKPLLDKAIYPDGFEKTVEQLRGKLLIRQRDLGVIESQVVRIAELEVKVRELSGQISRLNLQNEKLMNDVKGLSENIKKLSGDLFNSSTPIDSLRNMIVTLRQGLQERDALIFALTDSLFLQYDKNVGDMKDVEKQGLMGKMERHGIIGNVKRSIMDNMMFLRATQLKGSDLVTLVRQQQRFQSQWKGLGPKLTSLYLSGKTKKNEVIAVDSMLAVWGDNVDGALWRSLHMLFKEKGFTVKEFKNGEEFGSSFAAFLDDEIQNVRKDANDVRFKLFLNFNENFWQTDLNAVWLPSLIELHKITDVQKKEMDAKVDQWHSSVKPGVSWMIYVLIALCVVVVAMVAMRFFRKPLKTPPQA